MADAFGTFSFTTPSWRTPGKELDEFGNPKTQTQDLFGPAPSTQPESFNIGDSELFKASEATAKAQLGGDVPGYDAMANEAREAQKFQQANAARTAREGLLAGGMRDTGTYVQQGWIQPAQDQARERTALERNLASDRAQLGMQQQQVGQQAAGTLIGAQLGQYQTQEQSRQAALERASREGIAFAGLSLEEKRLAQEGSQFKDKQSFDKWALEKGLDENQNQRIWQAAQNTQAQQANLTLEQLKQQYAAAEAQKQREWQSSEASLQRLQEIGLTELAGKITSGQMIQQADIDTAMEQLKQQGQLTLQAGDIAATRENLAAQLALDKWKTEAGIALSKDTLEFNRTTELLLQSADAQTQTALMTLKGKIDEGLLVKGSDLEMIRAEFDRQTNALLQAGDFTNAMALQKEKQAFEALQTQKTQEYQTAERTAVQAWQTSERYSQNEYDTAMKYIDANLTEAQAQQDFGRVQQLETMKFNNDLALATMGMEHEEKMTYINDKLATARTDGDVARQKQLMTYGATIDLQKMATEQTYAVALQNNQANIASALSTQDANQARALMDAEWNLRAQESALDRQVEYARLAYEKAGVEFSQIEAAIESGQIAPDAAVAFLQQQYPDVQIQMPDPNAVYKEMASDYSVAQYQFALQHPDGIENVGSFDENGQFQLNDTYLEAFNTYLNQTNYKGAGLIESGGTAIDAGQYEASTNSLISSATGQPMTAGEYTTALRNADQANNANNGIYTQLLNNASALSVRISDSGSNSLSNVPDQGTLVNVGGRLMVVSKGQTRFTTGGRDADYFVLTDLATGKIQQFCGRNTTGNAGMTVNDLDTWADNIANDRTETAA